MTWRVVTFPHCWMWTPTRQDRKSTRLNSSHLVISYAVFCLKKKKSDHHARPDLNTTSGRPGSSDENRSLSQCSPPPGQSSRIRSVDDPCRCHSSARTQYTSK